MRAVNFGGGNANCGTTVLTPFTASTPFTIELWFKTTTVASMALVCSQMTGASGKGIQVGFAADGRIILRLQGALRLEVASLAAFNDGIWHHLAITYDGSSAAAGIELVVDGAVVGKSTVTANAPGDMTTTNPTYLAVRNGSEVPFTGDMRDIRVWRGIRTHPSQVLELMNSNIPVHAFTLFESHTSKFPGAASQGVATDGVNIYTTDNTRLRKFDLTGLEVDSFDHGVAGFQNEDMTVVSGVVYAPLTNYPTTPKAGKIQKLNATDLTLIETISLAEAIWPASIAYKDGFFWVSVTGNASIYKYDSTFNLVATYTFPVFGAQDTANWPGYSGLEWIGDYLYGNKHEGSTRGLDIAKWNGTDLEAVGAFRHASSGTTQGMAYDSVNSKVYWAARGHSNEVYQSLLTGGLIAKWSADEGSGTALNDSGLAPANNGTLSGIYTWLVEPGDEPPQISRDVIQKPVLPVLGVAGYQFIDPAFGTRLLRVTDGDTGPLVGQGINRSYRTPSASTHRAWNADSTRFCIHDTHGNAHPYNFNPATMVATQLGTAVLTISGEPLFHNSNPNLIYGKHGNRVIKVQDLSAGPPPSLATVVDLDTIIPGLADLSGGNTFMGGFSLHNDTIVVSCGGTGQDQHFYCVWYPISTPANVKVLNTLTVVNPATGVPFNSGNGFKLHSTFLDHSGRYVVMEVASLSNDPIDSYIWDTTLNTVTPSNSFMSGHRALGHGVMVNNESSGGAWDAAQWTIRNLATPNSPLRNLINPVLTPQQVYLADHASWNNSLPGSLEPFVTATYRYYVGTLNNVFRAWDDEIIRVSTIEGLSQVERFAHHRSNVSKDSDPNAPFEFWYLPRANVSPDGNWTLFTSNWEKSLGTDAVEGIARQDVFIVELAVFAGSPPQPPQVVARLRNSMSGQNAMSGGGNIGPM